MSIGVIVISSIVAVLWLRLRYRRRQVPTADGLADTQKHGEVEQADLSGLHELNKWGVVHETPSSGAIYEMAVQLTKMPDDHIREIAALYGAKLGSSSPVTSRGSARIRD